MKRGVPQSLALKITAVIGALGVGLGAFGAHGLKDLLQETGRTGTWETAALYHLVHAVVLLVLATGRDWRQGAWICMAAGICLFSGSLYLLCLTGTGWLGAITPLGGIGMMAGWLLLLRR